MVTTLKRRQVDIVGGGLAGLLAAIELAREGAQVTVLEAAGEFGGRARTREVDGFLFNRGPHALYRDGALKRALDSHCIVYSGGRALSGARKAIAGGTLHHLPATFGAILGTSLFGLRDKAGYVRVFKAVMDGASGAASFDHWLNEQQLTPMVRATVEAMARLASYAHAPADISARAMLDQMRMAAGGTQYVDGGWRTLVHGLAETARGLGVDLEGHAIVREVSQVDGELALTLANGDTRRADAAILALGPREAAALAPQAASLADEAEQARAVRVNTLDLALRCLPQGATDFALGIDTPFYFSVHSESARLAPAGCALVHVAKYLAPGETPAADSVTELEAVADLVMPGWRAQEVSRQALRGMTVMNALPRWDRPRAPVRVAKAPGLFVAGDWVGEHGMLGDAAAASAIEAAQATLHWLEGAQ